MEKESKRNTNSTHQLKLKNFELSLNEIQGFHLESSLKFNEFKELNTSFELKLLENIRLDSQNSAITFLFNITKDAEFSKKFISKILENPLKTDEIVDILLRLINGKNSKELLALWLNDESCGYKFAYNSYIRNIWSKSNSLEELVKISPNIAPWALLGKANELKIECVSLGEIPSEFCKNTEGYKEFINDIFRSEFCKSYIEAKNLEVDGEFCAKTSATNKTGKGDTLSILSEINKTLSKNSKPFKIRDFIVTPIVKSFSAKLIFSIFKDENEYILKINPNWEQIHFKTDKNRKISENFFLRPDMPYINAMTDFYLKFNNSTNAADIMFYDLMTDSALYKRTKSNDKMYEIPKIIQNNLYLTKNSGYFNELKQLGIMINDVNEGNFIINDQGKAILIDAGHIAFNHPFRPSVPGINFSLGNLCGREYSLI